MSCIFYVGIQSMRRNPVVTVEPSSPRIVEGGSLDISCKVAGVESGSVRFSWSKVGSPELPENTAARGNLIRLDSNLRLSQVGFINLIVFLICVYASHCIFDLSSCISLYPRSRFMYLTVS